MRNILVKARLPVVSIGVILFLITSCRKDPVSFDVGYQYYPVEIGKFVEYNVTEIFHDDVVGIHDTSIYQLKEVLESTFIDNEGRESYRMGRYKRDSSHHTWSLSDFWVVTLTNERLEKVEENQRFIRLTFPVKESEKWDGNALNQDKTADYEYLTSDEEMVVGGFNFPKTTTVRHVDFRPGVLFHEYEQEIYAENVGLTQIYSKIIEINLFDTLDVVKGTELYQTITAYGVE